MKGANPLAITRTKGGRILEKNADRNRSNISLRPISPERIHPGFVIIDQNLCSRDLVLRHSVLQLLKRIDRVRIATDRRQGIPQIGPNQVRGGHPDSQLVVPTDARLRPGMPFHRRAKIPFKGTLGVFFNPQTKRIHHPDQFFGVCIPRAGEGQKGFTGLGKFPSLHQIARTFDIGHSRGCQCQKDRQNRTMGRLLHILAFCLALPVHAVDLPRPLTDADFLPVDAAQAKIGQLLFYDKILSGNRNISCGTCHHHDLGGSDGLSLGIGEGGAGLGRDRHAESTGDRIRKRIPRNAPALWNLGAREVSVLFHDGRLETSNLYGNGFNSPAEEWLPQGLNTILAAQALFPLTARFEMAGDPEENEISGAVNDRIDNAWPILAKRVRIIPKYGQMFVAAFDHIDRPEDVTIVEIANALGAFMASEWRNHDSPFDRYLNGDEAALNAAERRGLDLFFGKANCASCHSGPLLSDQNFYALALPAFGPGKTRRFDPQPRDVGRMAESDLLEDAYRFRTPMLRNVALTAPYGHNGAYPDLEGIVRHHLAPLSSLSQWTPDLARLPNADWLEVTDFIVQADVREAERHRRALDIEPVALGDEDVADIVAFLESLTGNTARRRPLGRPDSVPSGLPVD